MRNLAGKLAVDMQSLLSQVKHPSCNLIYLIMGSSLSTLASCSTNLVSSVVVTVRKFEANPTYGNNPRRGVNRVMVFFANLNKWMQEKIICKFIIINIWTIAYKLKSREERMQT